MSSPTLYTVQVETIEGPLREEEVSTVHMPRSAFLDLLSGLLDDLEDHDEPVLFHVQDDFVNGVVLASVLASCTEEEIRTVREIVMPVAEVMARFPLNNWMVERGCGCLIGETIIAAGMTRREALALNMGSSMLGHLTAKHGPRIGGLLFIVGGQIDKRLSAHLNARNVATGRFLSGAARAVIFED